MPHSVFGGEAGPNYDDYKVWANKAGAQLRGTHDVHHKGGGNRGADNPDVIALSCRDEMLCACMARFIDKLKEIRASDGTLLDHTAILFGGAQTASHVGSSFPTILAGATPWLQAWPARQVDEGQAAHVRPLPEHPAAAWLPGELVQGKRRPNRRLVGLSHASQYGGNSIINGAGK
ncbi:hypothetical protein N9D63_09815 [Opitutales bacterium]|nr:hypothetical protein [Opitutales bacterium]